ncbi:putative uncharacterized protein [Ruminococcus sp. CAG:353]|jgi:hypothetical protein|nr:putative uncharacterized protein [Ruminococcus sp. CAG:353]
MERRKAANNEIFDILLKSALITRYENEVSAAMLSADEHTYPAEFHRRLRQIKNTAGRKERISAAGRVFSRLAVTAAAAMGILFGCLLTRPEVSAAVGNVFRSIFSTHDSYSFTAGSDTDFNQNIRLGYVPEGYELREAYYSENNVILTYESTDSTYIFFEYGLGSNSQISYDNERHKFIEINNNNTTYYFYEAMDADSESSLIWYQGGYYYSIDAQISKKEFVKMAENIQF